MQFRFRFLGRFFKNNFMGNLEGNYIPVPSHMFNMIFSLGLNFFILQYFYKTLKSMDNQIDKEPV